MLPSLKKNSSFFYWLIFSLSAFAQQVSAQPARALPVTRSPAHLKRDCPSCQNLFMESARILPVLYLEESFDSIAGFLDTRQQCCPNDVDVFCLKILLAIETNKFTKADLVSPELYFQLRGAAKMLDAFSSGKVCRYYCSRDFDGCEYAHRIFGLIEDWAKGLIATRPLDSTALSLCRMMAGNFPRSLKSIRGRETKYAFLDSQLIKAYDLHRDAKMRTSGLTMGALLPTGHLKALGGHPGVYISLGIRHKRSEWDITGGGQFFDAPRAYSISVRDTLHPGHHFDGWSIGLDYSYYISHTRHFEWGVTGGIGFMGMDIGYTPTGAAKATYQQPSSFYQSAGFRMNYFFDHYNPGRYLGLTAKYIFLNYGGASGINLGGNAIRIDITYGGNH